MIVVVVFGIISFVVMIIIISLISIGIEVCFMILNGEIFVILVIVMIMLEMGDRVWFRFDVCSIGIVKYVGLMLEECVSFGIILINV